MGIFGKKDDAKPADAPAEEAKTKHDAEHVDENGNKKPDVEVAGEVCEFC